MLRAVGGQARLRVRWRRGEHGGLGRPHYGSQTAVTDEVSDCQIDNQWCDEAGISNQWRDEVGIRNGFHFLVLHLWN